MFTIYEVRVHLLNETCGKVTVKSVWKDLRSSQGELVLQERWSFQKSSVCMENTSQWQKQFEDGELLFPDMVTFPNWIFSDKFGYMI